MKRIKLISLAIAALTCSTVSAADIEHFGDIDYAEPSLIMGMACRHFDSDDHAHLNEINPSIGIEAWDVKAVYVSKNSWNEPSLYATWSPDHIVNEYVSLSADIGLATGYKRSNHVSDDAGVVWRNSIYSAIGVIPLVAVTIDYSPLGNNFNLSISIAPQVGMLSVSYEL